MKKLSDAELNRLLAGRNRLTQADKDAVLEAVLDKLPPGPSSSDEREPSFFFFAGWMRWAALAAIVLLAAPLGYLAISRSGGEGGDWTARGGAAGTKPTFSVFCAQDMAEGRCARGGKLLFKVDAQGARRFAALARGDSGAVVWYFESLELEKAPAGGLLPQGVPLGSEHPPGHWEVFGIFSERPLSKAEIRALLEAGGGGAGEHRSVEIVHRSLEVVP